MPHRTAMKDTAIALLICGPLIIILGLIFGVIAGVVSPLVIVWFLCGAGACGIIWGAIILAQIQEEAKRKDAQGGDEEELFEAMERGLCPHCGKGNGARDLNGAQDEGVEGAHRASKEAERDGDRGEGAGLLEQHRVWEHRDREEGNVGHDSKGS